MKNIIAERVVYGSKNRITLRFSYDSKLNSIVRGFPDARWSKQMHCWHIKDSPDVIIQLLKAFYSKAYIDYSAMKISLAEKVRTKREEEQSKKEKKSKDIRGTELPPLSEKGKADIDKYRRWMEANRYPESTVQTYTAMIIKFLRYMSPKEASECTSNDLIKIIEEYILPKGLSYSFQNQMISSVKKFYTHIYKTDFDPGNISRPRPQHRLPNVLSKEEVKKILNSMRNEKHRVMLSLIYACGLRRGELIRLMPGDIERERGLLRIRQSKGFKDRIVPVSGRTIEMVDN